MKVQIALLISILFAFAAPSVAEPLRARGGATYPHAVGYDVIFKVNGVTCPLEREDCQNAYGRAMKAGKLDQRNDLALLRFRLKELEAERDFHLDRADDLNDQNIALRRQRSREVRDARRHSIASRRSRTKAGRDFSKEVREWVKLIREPGRRR